MILLPRKYLQALPSTIPGAGTGLFTTTNIPKGTYIIEYTGKVSAWKDVDEMDGDNPYIFYVDETHVIDASKDKKSLGRYANDARGLTRIKGITNNAEYEEIKEEGLWHVYIVAKRDIPANSEILVAYGADYWKQVRENIKIERQQKNTTKK